MTAPSDIVLHSAATHHCATGRQTAIRAASCPSRRARRDFIEGLGICSRIPYIVRLKFDSAQRLYQFG